MKSGRPKNGTPTLKHHKGYLDAGRHYKRLEGLVAKREKLSMIEALIETQRLAFKPDYDYIRDLKRRANEVRQQLTVLSTHERIDRI